MFGGEGLPLSAVEMVAVTGRDMELTAANGQCQVVHRYHRTLHRRPSDSCVVPAICSTVSDRQISLNTAMWRCYDGVVAGHVATTAHVCYLCVSNYQRIV